MYGTARSQSREPIRANPQSTVFAGPNYTLSLAERAEQLAQQAGGLYNQVKKLGWKVKTLKVWNNPINIYPQFMNLQLS